jgi:uncharacterized protein YqeY
MTIKQKISQGYMDALRSKDVVAKNLLSVLKGAIQTIEKSEGSTESDLSDTEVIKLLNSTAKSLREVISVNNDEESIAQLKIVESLLPAAMSAEEIQTKVDELIANGVTNMGAIMKEFATVQVDRKLVSEIIKNTLATV